MATLRGQLGVVGDPARFMTIRMLVVALFAALVVAFTRDGLGYTGDRGEA